jgi:hypothetical protein
MSEHSTVRKERLPTTDAVEFSNAVRLTLRQWLGVGLFTVVFVVVAPTLWKQVEEFPLEPDYRMPHELSSDYWLFERYVGLATQEYDTVVIGDSVVWGEYVTRQETLSHYLNQQAVRERYANLGLGGAHQLALTGLIGHYAGSIANRNVLLHCNPLWMSSRRADLTDDSDEPVHNHPRLIPQFLPRIPRYKEEISTRLGVLVEQRLASSKWTNHLQQAYYDKTDIPAWTLAHPYDNPLEPLTQSLPPSDNELRHLQQPWYQDNKSKVDFEWFERENSQQWRAFLSVVEILQQRGNRVFVLVGPLNEHMLSAESLHRYQEVKGMIAGSLRAMRIPHLVADPLPTEQYGDASHPLPEGYATLARQLHDDPAFRSFVAR